MADLIYCKNFPHGPRDCSGITYQATYDIDGEVTSIYRCNLCYQERAMSEHSILLATQSEVERLEAENVKNARIYRS